MNQAWTGLREVLSTDPGDVGCEQTWELIDAYAELVIAGKDPERTYPGISAHLRGCDPCTEDYRGLLHAMQQAAERQS